MKMYCAVNRFHLLGCLLTFFLLNVSVGQAEISNTLDLTVADEGMLNLNGFEGSPDEYGVFETYALKLPEFSRAVYYQGYWWPSGGNRVYAHIVEKNEEHARIGDLSASGPEGGIFLLLELNDGRYMAVLPLVGTKAYAWLDASEGSLEATDRDKIFEYVVDVDQSFRLKFGHHGRDAISGDLPLCTWAVADEPYTAVAKVWRAASEHPEIQGRLQLRGEKDYPEIFEYLGWCSWDGYHLSIDEAKILAAIDGIKASDIPIRYVLMDDGHYDRRTVGYDQEKFPESYTNMLAQRDESTVRWMGIWYAMFGTYAGMKDPEGLAPIQEHLFAGHQGKLVPRADLVSVRTYYRYIFRDALEHDFDLVKIDFQTHNMPFLAGNVREKNNGLTHPNPVEACTIIQQGFHEVINENFEAMINCNWHNGVSLFNSYSTSVGRCCEDNRGGPGSAASHTYHAFTAMPWLGQIAWGDHDMFHSGDQSSEAAEMNAMAKALSGGPVYLSDTPEHLNADATYPLCYDDGRLLRPLAPGAPLPEDLFYDQTAPRLFRAIAPLPHAAAVIMVMNLHHGGEHPRTDFTTRLTAKDYAARFAMMQPRPDDSLNSQEKLLVYDFQSGRAETLSKDYEVALTGFGSRLVQFQPIHNGRCVIGRTDKYLSAATIQSVIYNESTIDIELHEAGPLAVWSKNGIPKADGLDFQPKGAGLYIADMEVGGGQTKWRITFE